MSHQDQTIPASAEVVVAGGGVIGTACAYYLAKRGVKVCLAEREDIGAGTTRAAAAAALLQTKTSAYKLGLASHSMQILDQLHQAFDSSFEFNHTGSLLVACDETELAVVKDMVSKLQSLGLDVQFLDGDDARRIMPVIGPKIIGASFSPSDAQINPLELVTSFARQARKLGAQLCTFTEVTHVETQGEKIVAVDTTRGKIMTETIVDATGVWSADLAKRVGFEIPVTPLKGELMVTEPMPPRMQGTLISARYLLSKASLEKSGDGTAPKRSVGITLVQVKHGNFIIGSTREVAGFDRRSTFAGICELSQQLVELSPSVSDLHIIRAYAGLRPITPDGMPIIARAPGLPGFIVAAGHGGDGLILSAITAEMVANLYTGQVEESIQLPLSFERFII